jgi:transposase
VHRCTFSARVADLLENEPELRVAIEPLLDARNLMRRQYVLLDRHLSQIARKDEVCRRLMTISGVGPIVSLAFKASSMTRCTGGRRRCLRRGQLCRAIGRGPAEREGAAITTYLGLLYPQLLPDLLHSDATGNVGQ